MICIYAVDVKPTFRVFVIGAINYNNDAIIIKLCVLIKMLFISIIRQIQDVFVVG